MALVETRELAGMKVHTHIPDNFVMRHNLVFPNIPQKELELAIRNDLETKINFPIENASYDYFIDKTTSSKDNKIKVNAFISPTEQIQKQINLLKEANLVPNL